METLTTEEITLLRLLDNDSTISDKTIAKKMDMDTDKVVQIRNKLEKEGIILKYKAIINWEKIESQKVSALIQVSMTISGGSGYDSVAKKIAKFKEVKTCLLISGSFDLLVEVEGSSLRQLAFFVADKLAVIEGVEHTRTNFLLKRYKQNGDILTGSKTHRLPFVV